MKTLIIFIGCTFLFVQKGLFGQIHKLKGLWINTQYQTFKDAKNQDLAINCTPQYIEIDSLGNTLIINNIEHSLDLGLPKKIIKYGKVNQYIFKKNFSYYITEVRNTSSFITLDINNNGLRILFEKIISPY